jgi:O-antigen/teichoic acid export membrane protein
LKKKILLNLFSSGLQAISVQILGVFFFYYISLYLSKDDFGLISWGNASALFITSLLSLGLEQIIVRRIATSNSSNWAAAAFLLHSLFASIITFLFIIVLVHFTTNPQPALKLFPWFFAAQALLFIAVPLKQLLNAKEIFTPYGIIALCSNLLKIAMAFYIIKANALSINGIIWILSLCAAFELFALLIYIVFFAKINFVRTFKFTAYKKLIKEAAPQYVSVIFDMSLSRTDWILLGILSTHVVTADYSFAYRAYEVARLPLTIIAPLLLVRFSKLFSYNKLLQTEQKETVKILYSVLIFISFLLPLVLNILWGPLVSMLTKGKYGFSNANLFLLLSLCIPFQFIINLLWTICFSGKNYKVISFITITSAIINVILNLILIPKYAGIGAAIAFVATNIFQFSFYFYRVNSTILTLPIYSFMLMFVAALISYKISIYATSNILMELFVSVFLYTSIAILLKQFGKPQIAMIQSLLKRPNN